MNFNVVSPRTTGELLSLISDHQHANFCFGAGCTDLLPLLKKQPIADLTVINLGQLRDDQFTAIRRQPEGLVLGALTTAHRIVTDGFIRERFPVLHEAACQLASRQIRQVATVGGNLCTASPAGDLACALVALKAQCHILSAGGTIRTAPLEKFILGVRKIDLLKDEILREITIPVEEDQGQVYSHFIKVGARKAMEIAVVSLAYHLRVDGGGRVTSAGIALGSVAPRIPFAHEACEFLLGRSLVSLSQADRETLAVKVMSYAAPISDLRASAWYRREVLNNLIRGGFDAFESCR